MDTKKARISRVFIDLVHGSNRETAARRIILSEVAVPYGTVSFVSFVATAAAAAERNVLMVDWRMWLRKD